MKRLFPLEMSQERTSEPAHYWREPHRPFTLSVSQSVVRREPNHHPPHSNQNGVNDHWAEEAPSRLPSEEWLRYWQRRGVTPVLPNAWWNGRRDTGEPLMHSKEPPLPPINTGQPLPDGMGIGEWTPEEDTVWV
jgi:hypothetical protein